MILTLMLSIHPTGLFLLTQVTLHCLRVGVATANALSHLITLRSLRENVIPTGTEKEVEAQRGPHFCNVTQPMSDKAKLLALVSRGWVSNPLQPSATNTWWKECGRQRKSFLE